ncbi:hypothetical protein [Mesorhizobium sp. M0243]
MRRFLDVLSRFLEGFGNALGPVIIIAILIILLLNGSGWNIYSPD